MDKIVLTGYMGSGKSVVAEEIQRLTGIETIDLDREIEKSFGLPVKEIFKTLGEIAFRKRESGILRDLMIRPGAFVLALGGGTPCYADNAKFLDFPGSKSIFLRTSIKTLADRLTFEDGRPLLQGIKSEERVEFIAKHLFERNQFYQKANLTIDTDGKTPFQIAGEILNQLRNA